MKLGASRLLLSLTLMLLPGLAMAGAGEYVDLPAEKGTSVKMKVRFVRYTGGTNGHIVVDIANKTQKAQAFDAKGLYFVPDGDPERAPQRLGAAGPFQVQKGNKWQDQEELKVKPGETRRLKLQVFCLDSHRSSPGSSQGFSVARDRLPKKLRKKISKGAKDILTKNGYKMPASKSEIQSHVWQSRNKKWIKLQGERKQEKSPPPKRKKLRKRDRVRQMIQSNQLFIQD